MDAFFSHVFSLGLAESADVDAGGLTTCGRGGALGEERPARVLHPREGHELLAVRLRGCAREMAGCRRAARGAPGHDLGRAPAPFCLGWRGAVLIPIAEEPAGAVCRLSCPDLLPGSPRARDLTSQPALWARSGREGL